MELFTYDRLREWLGNIVTQFGGSAYLVGSALRTATPRDIDLRLLLPDVEFEKLFGPVQQWVEEGRTGNWSEVRWNWSKYCTRLTHSGWEELGTNIDFQIYPESWAKHKHGREPKVLLASGRDREP